MLLREECVRLNGWPLKILGGIIFLTVILSWIWFGQSRWRLPDENIQSSNTAIFSIFTQSSPANENLKEDLLRLRQTERLRPENEILLNRSLLASSEALQIPPAILWCLLFQESRLNHLEGIEGDKGARGLGQFSYFSFYEINHHLDRFTDGNLKLIETLLGKDVRPVEARQMDLVHPSSYYFIPTAVATSASYLNNRYLHLKGILEKRGLPFDRDLLWLYSAMAYNKGTRTVLNFWESTRKAYGPRRLEKLLTDRDTLFHTLENTHLMNDSLKRIWPTLQAGQYGTELKIHMSNMKSCTIDTETQSLKRTAP